MGILDPLVQEKLEADTEFQQSISQLPDTEREEAIRGKTEEIAEAIVADLKEKAEKAGQNEELARNQRIRAEKAEKELKRLRGEDSPADPQVPALSAKDIVALSKADVHEDDHDDVLEFAQFKKITVAEALKSPILKATLAEKEENRKAAAAANRGPSNGGTRRLSDAELLSKYKNVAPEPGSEDAQRLFWLRRGKPTE